MYIPIIISELQQYSKAKAIADLFAGLTVGVVALPLAMAFAIASGLPPERGLFTAIIGGFLISALGGSRVQIGGPTGAFVVLVGSVATEFGYAGLAACTVIAGGFLILFGFCRLGGLIKFVPFPVITGFTTGMAVVIFSTQVRDLFGLPLSHVPAEFIPQWSAYLRVLPSCDLPTAAIGLGTIAVIVGVRRWWPRLPSPLLAMVSVTALAAILQLDVDTIGTRFGALPRVLPGPTLPIIPAADLGLLVKPAFTIALLAAIEALLSATVADGMIGGRHNPNMELVGQGVANIGSIVFGGIPATGAIARTATNIKSGAQTPVAGIVHALVLALLLLLLAPLATRIPLAALAGILAVVSYNMSELHHFASILRGPKSDAFVLVLTFLLTVFVDLTLAVQVGVVLAALLFIRRMSEITNVDMITREVQGDVDRREDPNALALREVPPGVEVFEVNGPFFFGMIDTFKNALRAIEKPPRVLVIRMRNVLAVDATGIHVLRELHDQCGRDHTALVFSGVHSQPRIAFERTGYLDEVGRDRFLENIDDALNVARSCLGLPPVAPPTLTPEAVR